jgi:hypothetical protein
MIPAKVKELKASFYRHRQVYIEARNKTTSHYLLLFYAVECGLKVLLLNKFKGSTTGDFERIRDLQGKLLGKNGHNLKMILKLLNYNKVALPALLCANGSGAESDTYNQVWRYGIAVRDKSNENEVVNNLEKISEWIIKQL